MTENLIARAGAFAAGVPLNIDWRQILLHLLNFVILFAVLYFLLYKPVKNYGEKRKKHYADLDAAAKDKDAEAEAKKAGGAMKLAAYTRFEKGEGLQKREDNFAEEVAAMAK